MKKNDDDVFMTDEYAKWEKVRNKAFTMVLNAFVKWLGTQDKLLYADDLLDDLSYTYMGYSWNKMDVCRVILWKGVLMKEDQDAQINIEIQRHNGGCTYVEIYTHKKGLPLTEGWKIAKAPNADDMIRALKKDLS